jgi:hypothetical protein
MPLGLAHVTVLSGPRQTSQVAPLSLLADLNMSLNIAKKKKKSQVPFL